MGRAGRRALSQDHEIRLITKGWEAVTMHDGKWGELQVEGIPGQRCRKGRNQEPGGPQSCRVRGSATGNEAKEASDEKKKNMQGSLVTEAFDFHSRRKGKHSRGDTTRLSSVSLWC